MIVLTNEILEKKEQATTIIKSEKDLINSTIKEQTLLKHALIENMQKLVDYTVSSETAEIIINFSKDFKNTLSFLKTNIILLHNLTNSLDDLLLKLNNNQLNIDAINIYNTDSSEINNTVSKNTLQINETLQSASILFNTDSCHSTVTYEPEHINKENITDNEISQEKENSSSQSLTVNSTEDKLNSDIKILEMPIDKTIEDVVTNNNVRENTLIISESKGKIILPYTTYALEEELQNSKCKYSSIEEIIEKKYTLPINSFKNPSIARFREAFKLIRKKEKASLKEAFDLGMELLFNYNLHPAIISACKDLDELDIYLDYLEDNKTDKFDCFKIVFDVAPTITRKKKM